MIRAYPFTPRLPACLAVAALLVGAHLIDSRTALAGALECGEVSRQLAEGRGGLIEVELTLLLYKAAENGCLEEAGKLIAAGALIDARQREGDTPLHVAARAGEVEVAELLIQHGAGIEARNLKGSTPLLLAAEANQGEMIDFLLDKGARPDTPGRTGVTPLAAAAFNGADAAVAKLIGRGADPAAPDATGKSPLLYACARGFTSIVEQLLAADIDVNSKYGHDLTALMWAAGHSDDVPVDDGVAVVEMLLAQGAKIDEVDDRGRSALMTAAELGHGDVVALLLKRGAKADLRDKEGKTALDLTSDDAVRAALGQN